MSGQTWIETLALSTEDGPTVDGTMGSASILPVACVYTFPPNYFRIGTGFRVTASGRISCDATTPGTLLLASSGEFGFNPSGSAITLNVDGKTDVAWSLTLDVTCRSTGPAATFMEQGVFTSEAVAGSPLPSVGGCGSVLVPSTPVLSTGYSSASPSPFDLFVALSAGTATTAITCTQYKIESLN